MGGASGGGRGGSERAGWQRWHEGTAGAEGAGGRLRQPAAAVYWHRPGPAARRALRVRVLRAPVPRATAPGAGAGSGGSSGLAPAVPDIAVASTVAPDPNHDLSDVRPAFTPWLVEEFNAPLDLDQDPIWTWGDGALFDGQTHMVEKNITFANGNMVLAITNEPVSGGYSFSAADNVADKPVSAAEFRSIYNEFRYGRYEVRIKSPVGASNNFLHTMFAYRAPAYLLWREIDIELTAAPQTSFISNIIVAPPGTRVWNAGIEDSTTSYLPYGGNGGSALPAGFNTSSDYHIYAFEWLPTSVKWFVDGTMVREKLDGVGKNNLVIPKESTKIIMNLWVFGTQDLGGGNPADNVYPIYGQYDWFRFYRWNNDTTYPCADQARSCVTAVRLEVVQEQPEGPAAGHSPTDVHRCGRSARRSLWSMSRSAAA